MKKNVPPLVLSVDDDPIHNKMIDFALKKYGLSPILTCTAKEFLSKLAETSPDLCLVDLNIDELGIGFSLIKAIRNKLGTELPVVVLSGGANQRAIAHAIEVGADDFIAKPVDGEVFASKLSRYVETEKLLASKVPLFSVPEGGSEASLEIEGLLQEINEYGFTIRSRHLLTKGASFSFESSIIHAATGSTASLLLTVTSTWRDEPEGFYGAFIEFPPLDADLLASVRRWLVKQRKI